jgi:hypothetical protein
VSIEEDLDGLDRSIRQLQIEWEKYFGGVERKPPNELKGRVETLIRRYGNAEMRNNSERFRYQTLTARYNTFNELWSKKLRAREEGKPLGVHGLRADMLPETLPPPAGEARRAAAPAALAAFSTGEVRVARPDDPQAVRELFTRFLEARQVAGETAAVKFESFQKIIATQAGRILKEKGAAAVDFRLETKDGKVSLKAKPVK